MDRVPKVLLTKRCSTCIYTQDGRLMHLQPGRVAEMTAQTIDADTNVICHKSKTLTGELDFDAWCRGNFDEKGPGQMMRIAERLGLLEERAPNSE